MRLRRSSQLLWTLMPGLAGVVVPLLWGCGRATEATAGSAGARRGGPLAAHRTTEPPTKKTYYVSSRGNDANKGLSERAAFRTLAKALKVVRPGEKILLLPGSYHEHVRLEDKGSRKAAIVIQGRPHKQTGAQPVLDGRKRLPFGIELIEATNIFLDNLEVKNYKTAGIEVEVGSQIVLRNLKVHDNGFASTYADPDIAGEGYGINVDEGKNVVIEKTEAYNNGPGPAERAKDMLGTGINTYELRDSVIRDNYAHDNIGGGILVEDSRNVLVEGNLAEGNELHALTWLDGGLWLDGGRDITVRNNTFRDNKGPGIQISDEDVQHPTGYVVENNQFAGNEYGLYIWNFAVCPFPPKRTLKWSGNRITGSTRKDAFCAECECSDAPPCKPCD